MKNDIVLNNLIGKINQGSNSASTLDWLIATGGADFMSYDLSIVNAPVTPVSNSQVARQNSGSWPVAGRVREAIEEIKNW